MDESLDEPVNRRSGTRVRFVAVLIIVALAGVLVLPGLIYLRMLPQPPAPAQVEVDNRTDAVYVVWASTDPSPLPTSDSYDLARFGFEIQAHSIAALPSDHAWDVIEVWTRDCEPVTTDNAAPDGSGQIVIDADGTVRTVEGQDRTTRPPAHATNDCALPSS
jgi:hypothetical protein